MKVLLIAAAIGLCRPSLPLAKRIAYAKIIETSSVDPLVIVALVDHESRWIETAVSKDHKDYGLGQIRRKWIPKSEWSGLLDGETNLRRVVEIVEIWRRVCRTKVKKDSVEVWLAGYAGFSRPKQGMWCGVKATGESLPLLKSTKWILARRDVLVTSP